MTLKDLLHILFKHGRTDAFDTTDYLRLYLLGWVINYLYYKSTESTYRHKFVTLYRMSYINILDWCREMSASGTYDTERDYVIPYYLNPASEICHVTVPQFSALVDRPYKHSINAHLFGTVLEALFDSYRNSNVSTAQMKGLLAFVGSTDTMVVPSYAFPVVQQVDHERYRNRRLFVCDGDLQRTPILMEAAWNFFLALNRMTFSDTPIANSSMEEALLSMLTIDLGLTSTNGTVWTYPRRSIAEKVTAARGVWETCLSDYGIDIMDGDLDDLFETPMLPTTTTEPSHCPEYLMWILPDSDPLDHGLIYAPLVNSAACNHTPHFYKSDIDTMCRLYYLAKAGHTWTYSQLPIHVQERPTFSAIYRTYTIGAADRALINRAYLHSLAPIESGIMHETMAVEYAEYIKGKSKKKILSLRETGMIPWGSLDKRFWNYYFYSLPSVQSEVYHQNMVDVITKSNKITQKNLWLYHIQDIIREVLYLLRLNADLYKSLEKMLKQFRTTKRLVTYKDRWCKKHEEQYITVIGLREQEVPIMPAIQVAPNPRDYVYGSVLDRALRENAALFSADWFYVDGEPMPQDEEGVF